MLRALSRKVPVFVEMNVRKGIRNVGKIENELLEGRAVNSPGRGPSSTSRLRSVGIVRGGEWRFETKVL